MMTVRRSTDVGQRWSVWNTEFLDQTSISSAYPKPPNFVPQHSIPRSNGMLMLCLD